MEIHQLLETFKNGIISKTNLISIKPVANIPLFAIFHILMLF